MASAVSSVSAGDDAPDLETGCEITLALPQAIAQTRSISKQYFDST
jgi:hypothetical protein